MTPNDSHAAERAASLEAALAPGAYDLDLPTLSELDEPRPHPWDGCWACVAVRAASDKAEALRARRAS